MVEAIQQKPGCEPGFRITSMSRTSVACDDRRVEVIVYAGAQEVFLHARGIGGRTHAKDDAGCRGRAQIDVEVFGLGGPVRSQQAKQGERRFDAGTCGPASSGRPQRIGPSRRVDVGPDRTVGVTAGGIEQRCADRIADAAPCRGEPRQAAIVSSKNGRGAGCDAGFVVSQGRTLNVGFHAENQIRRLPVVAGLTAAEIAIRADAE